MAAPLDHDQALALDHDLVALVEAGVAKAHDAGILTLRIVYLQHFRHRVEGVAVMDRRDKADLVDP
ncbi:hypothetical protein D3C81_2096450 [compost metagenome]